MRRQPWRLLASLLLSSLGLLTPLPPCVTASTAHPQQQQHDVPGIQAAAGGGGRGGHQPDLAHTSRRMQASVEQHAKLSAMSEHALCKTSGYCSVGQVKPWVGDLAPSGQDGQ